MSFVISFTDNIGTVHPNSFWTIRYLSENPPNQTAQLIYQGWHTAADYVSGHGIVGEKSFIVNNPSTFEQYFGAARINQPVSYYWLLDVYAATVDTDFAAGTKLSYLPLANAINAIEIGDQGPSRISVHWRGLISTGGGASLGVTIKINGSTATISSSSLAGDQLYTLYYDIVQTVIPTDVVTFAYDGLGNLEDDTGRSLVPVIETSALNLVGAYWRFNDASNSGQFAIFF